RAVLAAAPAAAAARPVQFRGARGVDGPRGAGLLRDRARRTAARERDADCVVRRAARRADDRVLCAELVAHGIRGRLRDAAITDRGLEEKLPLAVGGVPR